MTALEQPIFVQLVRLSTNPIQTANARAATKRMTSLKVDEIGATGSVAPGKKHYSSVSFDGATVLRDSTKKRVLLYASSTTHKK